MLRCAALVQRGTCLIIQFVRGFCMALADSVPGISGGTIAFLMGFYTRFINSLHDLFRGNKEERKAAFFFLIKLGVGWVVGFALCVAVLSRLFEQHIYAVSSLFVGLTLFAIPFILLDEKENVIGKYKYLIFTALGIGIVVGISQLRLHMGETAGIDLANLSVWQCFYVVLSAAIAISAMILPGISGSSLLLIMGLYLPIIKALGALLSFDFQYLFAICLFIVGILLGAVCSIGAIRHALRVWRPQMLYLIIGLMLGSVYAIFMGPTTLDVPVAAMSLSTFRPLFFLLGGGIMVALEGYKRYSVAKEKKAEE